jgi:poly(3-hydroxybutyrate) depolymerase
VMDLTAEFYLQTIETVFVRHLLSRGLMSLRGRRVDMAAIHRPALMTIEGEHDDITGAGQCHAALDLCTNIPAARKSRVDCGRVGHYGIFNGSHFRSQVAPRITKFIRSSQLENLAPALRRKRYGLPGNYRRRLSDGALAKVSSGVAALG